MTVFKTEVNAAFVQPIEVTSAGIDYTRKDWAWGGDGASTTNDDASLPKACGKGDYCFYTSSSSNENRGGDNAMDFAPFGTVGNSGNYWRAKGNDYNQKESLQWHFPKKVILQRVRIRGQTFGNPNSVGHGFESLRLQYWDSANEVWAEAAQVREDQRLHPQENKDEHYLFNSLRLKSMLTQDWRILFPARAADHGGDVPHIGEVDDIRYLME